MGATPIYGLRYPALSNSPNVPLDVQNLAEDVESEIERIDDAMASLGPRRHRVDTSGSTASTSYTGTLSAGGSCGIDFVAPDSGSVTIHFAAVGFGVGTTEMKTAVRVGTAGTVGAGTQVHAPNDNDMILGGGVVVYGKASFADVSGLTPGSTYNVQLQHKVDGGTGTWLYRRVKVMPDP